MTDWAWVVLAFLSGSLPFSVWVGRWVAGTDIRRYGDHNPGATNAWRAGRWRAGAPALVLDFAKGAAPVAAARALGGLDGVWLVLTSLAPILGHAFTPFLGFRGGKALAVTFGVWAGLTMAEGPLVLGVVFLALIFLIKPDGWATIFGFALLGIYLLLRGFGEVYLAAWLGNFLILAWKNRRDLASPPRLLLRAGSKGV